MSIRISQSLHHRLTNAAAHTAEPPYPAVGVIGGLTIGNNVFCVSAAESPDILSDGLMPAGIVLLQAEDAAEKISETAKKLLPNAKGSVLLVERSSETSGIRCRILKMSDFSIGDDDVEVVSDESIMSQCVIVKLTAAVKQKDTVAVNDLQFKLKDSAFCLKKSDKTLVQDIYGHVVDDESRGLDDVPAPADMKKKMREKHKKQRIAARLPLTFSILNHPPASGDMDGLSLQEALKLSVCVLVPISEKAQNLHKVLSSAVQNQLRQLEIGLTVYNSFPKPFLAHFLTTLYPTDSTDEQLRETRHKVHLSHFLPFDRPYVRKSNHFSLPGDGGGSGHLMNPHNGLLVSGMKAPFATTTVTGSYTYHHYMQDHVDDSGWGCAYRSLQTIVSWFRLQGYVTASIPTHKQIQEALVACGDKPASFVGSKKWIGSNEVGFVLNQLFGITCKMLFVSSGADLSFKGRELEHHFKTQGTPVMIGGGVLAHTILGVCFSEKTGDIRFLILDPHYTGAEDMDVVQKKGWCGWKSGTFWDKNAFYNLCLPQRPIDY